MKNGGRKRYQSYLREVGISNWMHYIEALRKAGRLVRVGKVYCDGESLFRRRFTCDTRTCSPTKNRLTKEVWRQRGDKSCCAELVVDLTDEERSALGKHWPKLQPELAKKSAWFRDAELSDCLEADDDYEITLRKRGGRCVFALRDPQWGIRCGIHSVALQLGIPVDEVKPVTCDTFPLIVIDLTGGEYYMGAHDSEVNSLASIDDDGIKVFACLRDARKGPRLYESMQSAIVNYFGEMFYAELDGEAQRYLAGPKPKKLRLPEA